MFSLSKKKELVNKNNTKKLIYKRNHRKPKKVDDILSLKGGANVNDVPEGFTKVTKGPSREKDSHKQNSKGRYAALTLDANNNNNAERLQIQNKIRNLSKFSKEKNTEVKNIKKKLAKLIKEYNEDTYEALKRELGEIKESLNEEKR
jgi:hypothetical protein